MTKYFQDMLPGNHCFGCGPFNDGGLQIKSSWASDNEALCEFNPQPHHCAAPTKFLNGGIIATIIDCHCICTAIAHAYKKAGREIGEGEDLWYATGKLEISYLRPTMIDSTAILRASVVSETESAIDVKCVLESNGKECATALVTATAIPASWMAD